MDNGKENGSNSIIGYILGLYGGVYRDNGNHGSYYIVYWGYIGIMEKKVETIIMGLCRGIYGLIGVI